jgi:hypothetical protein
MPKKVKLPIKITVEQAISCLATSGKIHTYLSAAGAAIGADMQRGAVIEKLKSSKQGVRIAPADNHYRAHGHSIVCLDGNNLLYIEADEEKVLQLEKTLNK